ncbi:ABC transporter substrate-binding protein [Pleomorphomonas sp. JP5]|uniref:ABC transporter substrate-binding protein n=1 Tax=Pleomorphomonas sp. JP5 TaxID=2942998 RepID=UPI002042C295|nr:ABC transporter substrate-binding protein [Pleomorphomonas sp. JP5]MCM5558895.1 ABC transporter substrate-binding protein [Pleomorphomonas sp. JP5]
MPVDPVFSPMLSRRQLLRASAAAGFATMLPASLAFAATPVKLAMGWVPNVEHAGVWIALEKGYFAAEGVDFSYSPGGPNAPDPLVVLESGKAQLAASDWLPFMDAYQKNNDLVILASAFPTSPAALLSLAKKPVREPKDLVGARILGQGPGNKTVVEIILRTAGLPLEYTMVPTGFSPEPLLAGDGDAYFCFATNQPITLEKMGLVEGKDFFVTLQDTLGYKAPGGVLVAHKSFVKENRAALVNYFKAYIKGWKENAIDPKVAAELTVNKFGADLGLDIDQQIRQNELQIPLTTAAGSDKLFWFDPALVDGPMAEVARLSGHKDVPPAKDLIDLGPLEEALAAT